MKQSILGCAFLLDYGGYFWRVILHGLRNCHNPEWKPLAGTDGLRVVENIEDGVVSFQIPHVTEVAIAQYTDLSKTLPGRLLIRQSEKPHTQLTVRLQLAFFLSLVGAALNGSRKWAWRKLIGVAILVLQVGLGVILITQSQISKLRRLFIRDPFQQLD